MNNNEIKKGIKAVEQMNKWIKQNKVIWGFYEGENQKKDNPHLTWIYHPVLFRKLMKQTVPAKIVLRRKSASRPKENDKR